MLEHHVNTVTSTSAGRLFDAVSALLGIRRVSTFEGEASMYLQFAAEAWEEQHAASARILGTVTAQEAPLPGEGRFLLRRRLSLQDSCKNACREKNPAHLPIGSMRSSPGSSHAAARKHARKRGSPPWP